MGPEGLNEFLPLFSIRNLDKEGLIIDDRANGGGNVSPMILERLSREPYRFDDAPGFFFDRDRAGCRTGRPESFA